jgi:glucan phosphoethanolaminetransferase (alkaline phosphatase superfamily)
MQNDPQNNPQNNQTLSANATPSIGQNTPLNQDNEDLSKKKLAKLHEKEIDFKNSRNSKMGYGLTLVVIASLAALLILAFNPYLYNQLLANSLSNLPIMLAGVGSISAIAIVAISGSGIVKNEKAKEEKQYDGVHTSEELANQAKQNQNSQQSQDSQSQQSKQSKPPSKTTGTSWTDAVRGGPPKNQTRSP